MKSAHKQHSYATFCYLSQIDALIFQRDLMAIVGMRKQSAVVGGFGRLLLVRLIHAAAVR
jgi:hypothetical protein